MKAHFDCGEGWGDESKGEKKVLWGRGVRSAMC